LITPTPAGGVADLFARLYGEWLTQRLCQPKRRNRCMYRVGVSF